MDRQALEATVAYVKLWLKVPERAKGSRTIRAATATTIAACVCPSLTS